MADSNKTAYRNGRVILDLTMSADRVVRIDEMNGHQGENGRTIKFVALGQNDMPENISNKTIDLVGVDSAGKTKISGNTSTIINPSAGTFDFTIPGAFYQRVGDYDRAYFRIKDNDNGNVTTVNVMFSVIQGVGYLSQGDSEIFNGKIHDDMAKMEAYFGSELQRLKGLLAGVTGSTEMAEAALKAMTDIIAANQAPTLSGNNKFTGQNTFNGPTRIDNLQSKVIDQLRQAINSTAQSVSDKLSNVLREDAFWTRDYTLGGALSRANNGNDFALSKWHIMEHVNLIVGRGDVHVNTTNQDYAEAQIYLPWVVDNADMAMSQIYHFEGYALPRLDVDSKKLNLSIKGQRDDIERLSLLIIAFDR